MITVSAASVSNCPVGRGLAGLVEFHDLDLHLRAVEGGDGAQPVDVHALAFGLLGLLLVGRHLRAGAPVDDDGVFGAEAAGHPGGVHRGVAAAVHRDVAPDLGRSPEATLRRNDTASIIAARVLGRDVDTLGQVGADRDERPRRSLPSAARRRGLRPGARR